MTDRGEESPGKYCAGTGAVESENYNILPTSNWSLQCINLGMADGCKISDCEDCERGRFAFLDASFLLHCESGCKLWGFSKKLFGSFSGFSSRPGNESAVKWVEMGWNAKSGILVVGGFKLRIMGEDLKFSNHGRSEDLNFKSGQSGQHKNCRHKEKEDLLISFNCTLGKCSKKNALHQIFLEGIYADSYI